MSHMVELGWICVSINYSKSPRCAFPAHLIDVKRAIAWVRENIADYGGDPDFIAITGGSAGGHLASLAALTPNDPTFQPGFEDADTTVQAAAPYYGVYDFTDFDNMHEMMLPFLEQFVMKARYTDEPERFKAASPISYVHRDAPPFFVLHGEKDEVVPSGQARAFCAALRDAGAASVSYAELANAHHAFDITPTVRSRLAAKAVADFLGVVYGRRAESLLDSRRCRPLRPAETLSRGNVEPPVRHSIGPPLSGSGIASFHPRVNPTSVVLAIGLTDPEAGGLIGGDSWRVEWLIMAEPSSLIVRRAWAGRLSVASGRGESADPVGDHGAGTSRHHAGLGAVPDPLRKRLPKVLRLRQKVVVPTLPTAAPRWVVDPDFNLDFHVRRVRVSGAGPCARCSTSPS